MAELKQTPKHFWNNPKMGLIIALITLFCLAGLCYLISKIDTTKKKTSAERVKDSTNLALKNMTHYQRGVEYYNKGNDYEYALDQFKRVEEADSNYTQAQEYMTLCNEKIDDIVKEKKQKEAQYDKERKQREKETAKEEAIFLNSKAGKIYKFCKTKNADVTKEECEDVANGKIWIGMNIWLVVAKRGNPRSINPSNYGRGKEYQYCWDFNWSPSCFYTKEDNIVYAYN
jgi:hypothetical protein